MSTKVISKRRINLVLAAGLFFLADSIMDMGNPEVWRYRLGIFSLLKVIAGIGFLWAAWRMHVRKKAREL
jgi:hypothetical protein